MKKNDDDRLDRRLSIRVNRGEYREFMNILADRNINKKQELLREILQRYLAEVKEGQRKTQ